MFFASADILIDAFDIEAAAGKSVRIDVSGAHLWDITAVAALEKVTQCLRNHGIPIEVVGMNAASGLLVDRLTPAR